MNCQHPRRIKNIYTGKYMYVPCRHCDACRIADANLKCALLSAELEKYPYKYFLTLTYDNYSVPFVIPGSNKIYRMAHYRRWSKFDDGFEPGYKNKVRWFHYDEAFPIDDLTVDETRQVRFCPGLYRSNLFNHEYSSDNAQGVIYRPDISNFFKLFRKNLKLQNGNFEFKEFTIGELGTKRKRPHFHVVLYSWQYIGIDELTALVVKSWPMSDWFRFFRDGTIKDKIKCADEGISSYLSSYVNGHDSRYGISSIKRFSQKTWRSKDIDFGVADEDIQRVKAFISRRYDRQISFAGRHIFEKVDKTKLDCVSTIPVSTKFVASLFHKFKGFYEVSPSDFERRARQIYHQFYRDKSQLKSDDLAFMRGFFRYKRLVSDLDLDSDLWHSFLTDFVSVLLSYNAYLLKRQMMEFEDLGYDEYYKKQINTHVEDLDKKVFFASLRLRKKVSLEELECPSSVRDDIRTYIRKYKKRLLGKHLKASQLADEML